MTNWLRKNKGQIVILYCVNGIKITGKVTKVKKKSDKISEQGKVKKDGQFVPNTTYDTGKNFIVNMCNIVYCTIGSIEDCSGVIKHEYSDCEE